MTELLEPAADLAPVVAVAATVDDDDDATPPTLGERLTLAAAVVFTQAAAVVVVVAAVLTLLTLAPLLAMPPPPPPPAAVAAVFGPLALAPLGDPLVTVALVPAPPPLLAPAFRAPTPEEVCCCALLGVAAPGVREAEATALDVVLPELSGCLPELGVVVAPPWVAPLGWDAAAEETEGEADWDEAG